MRRTEHQNECQAGQLIEPDDFMLRTCRSSSRIRHNVAATKSTCPRPNRRRTATDRKSAHRVPSITTMRQKNHATCAKRFETGLLKMHL
jgi:hypothetical protein